MTCQVRMNLSSWISNLHNLPADIKMQNKMTSQISNNKINLSFSPSRNTIIFFGILQDEICTSYIFTEICLKESREKIPETLEWNFQKNITCLQNPEFFSIKNFLTSPIQTSTMLTFFPVSQIHPFFYTNPKTKTNDWLITFYENK